jgi:hypothetical protein
MAPAHAAFEVGATLVRRFWIPSIESRLSSLFAALGTRASPRAVLEAPTPPLWATVLFGNARSYRDLAPGKSITGKVVSWDRNGVIFPDPGPYAVSVEARWFESGQPLAAEASSDVWVDYPLTEKENAIAAALLDDEVGKYSGCTLRWQLGAGSSRRPLRFCHRHVGFNRVGDETILVGSMVHSIEFFLTGSLVAAPRDLRA